MQPNRFIPDFHKTHPLWYRFFLFLFITVCVYLSFRYLLPLFFPFLAAYLLMRILFPVVVFFKKRLHFPSWLSYTTTLSLFFLTLGGGLFLLLWKLFAQIRLLFCNFPIYYQVWQQTFSAQSQKICHCLDAMFSMEAGTIKEFIGGQFDNIADSCNQMISTHAGTVLATCFSGSIHFFTALVMLIISMIILCKDMDQIHNAYRKSAFHSLIHQVAHTLKKTGLAYLKSQCIIIASIWFVCSLGLFIIHNPYAIILGLAIALFDAFPVLGSGMILVPWAIYHIFQGNYFQAAILFTILVLNLFLREFLEAKLMGNNMGLMPFVMIASIYVGVYLFGVWGILLGPFGTILIRTIYSLTSHRLNVTET